MDRVEPKSDGLILSRPVTREVEQETVSEYYGGDEERGIRKEKALEETTTTTPADELITQSVRKSQVSVLNAPIIPIEEYVAESDIAEEDVETSTEQLFKVNMSVLSDELVEVGVPSRRHTTVSSLSMARQEHDLHVFDENIEFEGDEALVAPLSTGRVINESYELDNSNNNGENIIKRVKFDSFACPKELAVDLSDEAAVALNSSCQQFDQDEHTVERISTQQVFHDFLHSHVFYILCGRYQKLKTKLSLKQINILQKTIKTRDVNRNYQRNDVSI